MIRLLARISGTSCVCGWYGLCRYALVRVARTGTDSVTTFFLRLLAVHGAYFVSGFVHASWVLPPDRLLYSGSPLALSESASLRMSMLRGLRPLMRRTAHLTIQCLYGAASEAPLNIDVGVLFLSFLREAMAVCWMDVQATSLGHVADTLCDTVDSPIHFAHSVPHGVALQAGALHPSKRRVDFSKVHRTCPETTNQT